jgi:hypothetical protein
MAILKIEYILVLFLHQVLQFIFIVLLQMGNNCKLKNVIAEIREVVSKTSKNLYIVTTGLSEGLPPT